MPLSHAILGFLNYTPMTGYDLKKYFDQSITHFWSAAQSQIYKELEKLETKNWVTSQIIPQEGKPNRKEYHITDEGRAELRQWLVNPLPLAPVREAWMIQLFFSHDLSNEGIKTLLENRKAEISRTLQELRGAQGDIDAQTREETDIVMERAPAVWQLTLDYGVNYYESEIEWLDRTIEKINRLPPLK